MDTLKCVLDHLFKLNACDDEIRALEIRGVDKNNFQQTIQLVKMHDLQTSKWKMDV
jgi:hypothetical protein